MRSSDDIDKMAAVLREMARHEDQQKHNRITWLCQLQGFLFASLGFAWGKSDQLTVVLAALGIATALLVFQGTLAASIAHQRIRTWWNREKPADYSGPDVVGFYPDRFPLAAHISADSLMPLVFVAGWAAVIMIR
jgi:hypothetical protein